MMLGGYEGVGELGKRETGPGGGLEAGEEGGEGIVKMPWSKSVDWSWPIGP